MYVNRNGAHSVTISEKIDLSWTQLSKGVRKVVITHLLNNYVLVDWVGGLNRKIFGPRSWRMDWAQQGPCAMTEYQIFSRTAWPNSVNKHFIIWPPCFSFFLSFLFFFLRVIKFAIRMFTYVAHFDQKVKIYIAAKLFQFASRRATLLAGLDGFLRPWSCHRIRPSYRHFLNIFGMKARMGPFGPYDKTS